MTSPYSAPRTVHAYDGQCRLKSDLVYVKIVEPLKISFIDDVAIKLAGGEILALLPGKHTLIAGSPTKQYSGNAFADNMANSMSENETLSMDGRPGDLFALERERSGFGTSMTMNGVTIPLPDTYSVHITPISNATDVASFFSGVSTSVMARLSLPCLDDPANLQDYKALQGRWRVVAMNMDGDDVTTAEFKKRAKTKGGDASMLDMSLDIRGSRVKWIGEHVRGETIMVNMDSHRTPKCLWQLSAGNGDDATAAIYDIQGDKLRYCFGSALPRSFTTTAEGPARLSFVLRREDQGATDNTKPK